MFQLLVDQVFLLKMNFVLMNHHTKYFFYSQDHSDHYCAADTSPSQLVRLNGTLEARKLGRKRSSDENHGDYFRLVLRTVEPSAVSSKGGT